MSVIGSIEYAIWPNSGNGPWGWHGCAVVTCDTAKDNARLAQAAAPTGKIQVWRMQDYRYTASLYDFALRPILKNIRRDVVRIALSLKPERVVDVACGTGEQLRRLRDHRINAIGIDLSEAMLRRCRKANPGSYCFLQDATAAAFQSASFDLAIASFALHETGWQAATGMVTETGRILKPGGHLLIVDYTDLLLTPHHVNCAIHIIEFMAGKRHYGSFREFLRMGGLEALTKGGRFRPIESRSRAAQSISVQLHQRTTMAV